MPVPKGLVQQVHPLLRQIEGRVTSARGDSRTPPAATPIVGLADELTKLAVLRDQGVLDEAEFDAAKASLLAGATGGAPAATTPAAVSADSAPATRPPASPTTLRLIDVGRHKIKVIKVVKATQSLSLKDAKDKVESGVLIIDRNPAVVAALAETLDKLGVTYELS